MEAKESGWELQVEERNKVMETAMDENGALLKENNSLGMENERLRKEMSEEVARQRDRRRAELEGVEARVKEVVSKKDETIMNLLSRASTAERRGAQLLTILKEIDGNFHTLDERPGNVKEA